MDKGFKAEEFMQKENIDEGSGKDLMEWYYKKDRTVWTNIATNFESYIWSLLKEVYINKKSHIHLAL